MADFKQEDSFKHKDKQQVSREEAAERLTAIAEALRTGGTVELAAEGRSIDVQVADQVLLEREFEKKGERVELELELSWSAPAAAAPTSNAPA